RPRFTRWARNRRDRVDDAMDVHRQRVDYTAARIDYPRYAGVGRANERKPAFDGPDLRLPKMLVLTRRIAEPGVVGDIDQNGRRRRVEWQIGNNDLRAGRGQSRRAARQLDRMPVAAGHEIHRSCDKLLQPETRQQVGEGQIFAEWHEMDLVHRIDDLAGIAD